MMTAWRSIALAAVGSAVAVVAGPAIGLDPWVGALISGFVALLWFVASSSSVDPDEEPDDPWVVLETYMNVQHAFFVRSLLQGSGIPCQLPDEHTVGARRELAIAIGGVRVMVPASEVERARDLLRSGEQRDDHR
jgi:putative signal transducing protein